ADAETLALPPAVADTSAGGGSCAQALPEARSEAIANARTRSFGMKSSSLPNTPSHACGPESCPPHIVPRQCGPPEDQEVTMKRGLLAALSCVALGLGG